jgi:hypothetical protein
MAMLDAATEQIDLLDLTLHGIATEPGVIEQLAAKAARGARVRILITAADSIYLTVHDQELRREPDPDPSDQAVSERERDQVVAALQPLINQPRIELREFIAGPFNSILRFDEQMLITPHLYGLTRSGAPMLHLRRRQDDGIFDRFAGHFDRIWHGPAEQLEPDTDRDDLSEDPQPASEHALETSGAPTPQSAQQALERLRAHRTI